MGLQGVHDNAQYFRLEIQKNVGIVSNISSRHLLVSLPHELWIVLSKLWNHISTMEIIGLH